MKTKLALLLSAFCFLLLPQAPAQDIQLIAVYPRDTNGTPAWALVAAEQLPFNICNIQVGTDVAFTSVYTGASYGCYNVDQYVVGSFNIEIFPSGFYRSENVPCVFGALVLAEARYALTEEEQKLRWWMKGRRWRLSERLESQTLPVFPFDEVKRWTAVPE